jgi:hypothetical protein
MIVIDNKLISDELFEEQFMCDLNACKGACCVAGDVGAPLEEDECDMLEKIYDEVKPYLTKKGRKAIQKQGFYVRDEDDRPTTTLIGEGGACAYVHYDRIGYAYCGIEKAYRDGKINFMKPVSCHLYPVRVGEHKGIEFLNYDRWEICKAACKLGKRKKMPVYRFVQDAIRRKYGAAFYEDLEATVRHIRDEVQEEQ